MTRLGEQLFRYVSNCSGKRLPFHRSNKCTGRKNRTDMRRPYSGFEQEGSVPVSHLLHDCPNSITMVAALRCALLVFALTSGLRSGFLIRNPPLRSIAVLPLDNLSVTLHKITSQMYDRRLSLILQINITWSSREPQLCNTSQLISRVPEIARALNVSAVVEGAVSRSRMGSYQRLSYHARNDVHLWAQDFDRDLEDTWHCNPR